MISACVKLVEKSSDKSVDNVVFVVYNRGINIKKGVKMTPQELKKLEEEHKKAMESIKAFNEQAKGLTNTINETLGK